MHTPTLQQELDNEQEAHAGIALENAALRQALAARNDIEVERILREEF